MSTQGRGLHLVSPTLDQLLAIRSHGGSEVPRWSPDGHAITFVSSLGGAPELWNVSPDGGGLQ